MWWRVRTRRWAGWRRRIGRAWRRRVRRAWWLTVRASDSSHDFTPSPTSVPGTPAWERLMDVVFAVMPFADVGRPALGVSLLSAQARAAGFSTSIEYCNITLAEVIGLELYQRIASSLPPDLLLGEWFFADDVFGGEIPDPDDYLEKLLMRAIGPDSAMLEELTQARKARS